MVSMASKRKQGKQTGSVGELQQQLARIERQLEKGFVKDALKAIKQLDRENSTRESRSLLERASVARVQQFYSQGNLSEAIQVAREIRAVGLSLPEAIATLEKLEVLLGIGDKGVASRLEADPKLLAEMVDKAILDPRYLLPSLNDLTQDVQRVRAALQAVEAGQDESAIGLLSEIPRSSPTAEWKLFTRDLIAFYQRDSERETANWQRLDPSRPAGQLAQTLLVASKSPSAIPPPPEVTRSVRKLELGVDRAVLYTALQGLAEALTSDDTKAFKTRYSRLCNTLGKSPAILDRLIEVLVQHAISTNDQNLFELLDRVGPSMTWDPKWNRTQALYAETNEHCCAEHDSDRWSRYLQDLELLHQRGVMSVEEHDLAVALVHAHIGDMYWQEVQQSIDDFREESELDSTDDASEPDQLRVWLKENGQFGSIQTAINHYGLALQSYPNLFDIYSTRSQLRDILGDREQACADLEALVQRSPDDYEAHRQLAIWYLELHNFEASERALAVIRRLKPRAATTLELGWLHCETMVREFVRSKQCEAARQELEKATQNPLPKLPSYLLSAMRSAIEYQAGSSNAAERYIAESLNSSPHPAVLWAYLARFSADYKLPTAQRKEFNNKFEAALKEKLDSAIGAELIRFLSSTTQPPRPYVGRAKHQQLVLKYLQRCLSLSWTTQDLIDTVTYLQRIKAQRKVSAQLLKKANKQAPNHPHVLLLEAQLEMQGSRKRYRLVRLKSLLEKTIKAANEQGLEFESVVQDATKMLAKIDLPSKQSFRHAFGPSSPYDDEEDEDDDLESEFYGSPEFAAPTKNKKRSQGFFDTIWPFRRETEPERDPNQATARKKSPTKEPSGGMSEAVFKRLLWETMPPDLKVQFEERARATGRTFEEVVDEALSDLYKRGIS